jgi:transcriptional regulator with XRE-family HTH domain
LFYLNFVRLCNSIGKSPSAVAEDMGLQRSSVTRWANGSAPRKATVEKIATYFGVDSKELTGEEQKEKPNALDGIELEKLSPARRALLEALEGMDDENIMKIVRIAQAVKKELPE